MQSNSNDTGLTLKKGFQKKRTFPKKETKPTMVSLQKEITFLKSSMKKKAKIDEPPLKYTYSEFAGTYTNAWSNAAMDWPTMGSGISNRLTDIIKIKSITFNFLVKASESDGFDNVRIIFIQWVDQNASGDATPAIGLSQALIDPTSSFCYLNQWNSITRNKYRVLFDKTYCVNYNGVATVADQFTVTGPNLTVNKGRMVYSNDSETNMLAPGLEGGYVVGFICSDSAVTPNPSVEYSFRMNFTDT